MRFAMFYLSEYAMLFAGSLFLAILFFGGYLSPFGGYLSHIIFSNSQIASTLVYFEQAFWLFLKSGLIIFIIILLDISISVIIFALDKRK
jgi:NADH-quinone oxidoreductase subunit H